MFYQCLHPDREVLKVNRSWRGDHECVEGHLLQHSLYALPWPKSLKNSKNQQLTVYPSGTVNTKPSSLHRTSPNMLGLASAWCICNWLWKHRGSYIHLHTQKPAQNTMNVQDRVITPEQNCIPTYICLLSELSLLRESKELSAPPVNKSGFIKYTRVTLH